MSSSKEIDLAAGVYLSEARENGRWATVHKAGSKILADDGMWSLFSKDDIMM
jgi:hypothetical protein